MVPRIDSCPGHVLVVGRPSLVPRGRKSSVKKESIHTTQVGPISTPSTILKQSVNFDLSFCQNLSRQLRRKRCVYLFPGYSVIVLVTRGLGGW